ncbi:hypothetical protein EV702DRAFT_704537 [Suillus placidus]|uniref:VWFA domain-containing protein n=1 Tax=Suillus placidus TaxID=48579 RepID=A0A9P6ZJN4_9AGAM|nr:hypothetical protein EV702DRAFT_704537 [Suillus placidus]
MTYQSKPTSDGVYRIKVLNQDLFIESVPGNNPGLKLASPSPTSNKQKWTLTQVSGQSNVWTMVSVEDGSGMTYRKTADTYWGYGYPYPQNGPSLNWSILERTTDGQTFSKIKLSGESNCFDSCSTGDAAYVRVYYIPDVFLGSDAVCVRVYIPDIFSCPFPSQVNFYYDHARVDDGPKQCFVFELVPKVKPSGPLDIMFLQDATGSQQPYIDTTRNEITQIYYSFIIQEFPFTNDFGSFAANLASLTATGGGGGPESQSDALSAANKADWEDEATKVVVLITDSPPHGIGEDGDGFPQGCPHQIDPLRIATRMRKVGITLYMIACEPTLSQDYKGASDFYQRLVGRTRLQTIGGCVRVVILSKPRHEANTEYSLPV